MVQVVAIEDMGAYVKLVRHTFMLGSIEKDANGWAARVRQYRGNDLTL
jgi:hypothetical protein